MKGLGHFPMSEDPPKFIAYLLPVLEKIATRPRAVPACDTSSSSPVSA